jgi:hypothetical protein
MSAVTFTGQVERSMQKLAPFVGLAVALQSITAQRSGSGANSAPAGKYLSKLCVLAGGAGFLY